MANKSIVKKLTAGSAILIVCAVCIALAANYWIALLQAKKSHQAQLSRQLLLLSQSVENPLWTFDDETIRLIGDAYMAGTDAGSLEIYLEGTDKPIYRKEKIVSANISYAQTEVTRNHVVIGRIKIGLSGASYATSLSHLLSYSAIVACITFILLYNVMRKFFREYLTKPLQTLGNWTDKVASGDYSGPPATIDVEELSSVTGKFSNMSKKIEAREQSLQISEKRFRGLFENTEVSIWNEDLTEVYDALERLRAGEVSNLHRYLRDNPEAAWELAAKVKVIQVNEATLKLFKAESHEQMHGRIEETFGPNSIETLIDELCSIWEKQKAFRAETSFRTLTGEEINAVISFYIPETREDFANVPVTIFDMTEQKRFEQALRESEEQFRLIFETNPDPVILANVEKAAILDVNLAFEELTGIPRAEARGHSTGELGFWVDNEYQQMFREQLQRDGEVNNFEAVFQDRNGENRIGLLSARNLTINNTPCALVTIRDITTEKAAEQALVKMDQMRNEFISTAAHELNTPLSTIIGYTELLLNSEELGTFSAEQRSEFLNEIYGRSEALSRIIDDLLDVSRIESGQTIPLNRQEAGLKKILSKTLRSYQIQEQEHRFRLELPAAGTDVTLLIDQKRINQVLENLLTNAVKYSPAGSEITLSGRIRADGWEISIKDQGIGMNQEQLERIFDKFYRADASNTAVSGLGLGMNIVKQIIEGHGGTIRVESSEGRGTTVIFNLPFATE